MRAAPRADDGVNLVDDDGPHRPQALAAALRCQQQVQRFRRRDEDVRRRAEHRLPRRRRRVAGAHGGGDCRRRQSESRGLGRNCRTRGRQVRVDVAAQRLERRHVDDADLVGQRRLQPFGEQFVEGDQERGQRLAGPGRRGNQRVPALADRRPALRLSRRRRAERGGKPPLHGGVKGLQARTAKPPRGSLRSWNGWVGKNNCSPGSGSGVRSPESRVGSPQSSSPESGVRSPESRMSEHFAEESPEALPRLAQDRALPPLVGRELTGSCGVALEGRDQRPREVGVGNRRGLLFVQLERPVVEVGRSERLQWVSTTITFTCIMVGSNS